MAIPKIDEQNITAAIKYIDEHEIPDKEYLFFLHRFEKQRV